MTTDMNHITIAVTDIDRSFDFYKDVVGLKPLVKWDNGAYFLAGDFWFCLNLDPSHKKPEGYTHYAFSVNQEEFKSQSDQIIKSGATIFKENTSPGDSLYFLDPDGHKLELHVGDWHTRIAAKKADPGSWKNIQWYN